MNTKNIEVSVVVPCLAEEDTLGVCLQKAQDILKSLNNKVRS